MANTASGLSRGSGLVDAALIRLSQRVAPLVQAELVPMLVAELERHFNEQLLSELDQRVEAIVARELQGQLRAILACELPAALAGGLPERVEAIITHKLPGRAEAVIDEVLRAKQELNPAMGPQLYRPNSIVAGSVAGEYMAASNTLARDFLHPEFSEFCRLFNWPVVMHRKYWEYAFIYERLRKAGVLRPGMRGVGFGVGIEKLPSIFASLGARITATDAPVAGHWQVSGQYAGNSEKLFYPDTISREFFDERVSFEFCDMNEIPGHLTGYDFCWSSCSFEHLGSLQHGIDFVISSVERCLKVGGVACHTTELNLSSDDQTVETGETVLYRKKDLERLCRLLEERGHWAEPLRIESGTLPPDYLVDVPPYRSDPHLKLLLGSFVTTSVGVVARRGR